jgi:rRNA maturation RNase YbeY
MSAASPKKSGRHGTAPAETLNLVIANRQRTKKIKPRLLRQIVDEVLQELQVENAELGVALVGATEMARMNRQFLQHEGSTDVITFDHSDEGQASRLSRSKSSKSGDRRDACPTLHGELFICVEDAVAQARQFRTSWQSEVVRYVVHGILHLLGHDDLQPDLRRKMKREENRLLRRLSRKFSLAQIGGGPKLRA